MLRISSNVAALTATRSFNRTSRETSEAMQELASGTKYSSASKDAAGFAISENLKAETKGFQAARANADNASSFIQVAEGALNEQNNILIRMRELAIQAASDTVSDTERGFINYEFQQINSELDRIAKSTKFGSQSLLDGSTKNYEFQVGVNGSSNDLIKYNADANTTASSLDVSGLTVEEKSDARDSLEAIDAALGKIGEARAKFGAVQSRLDSASSHAGVMIENLSAAYSRRADTDVAEAVTNVRRGLVLQQYQTAILALSNQQDELALKLIG